VTSSWFFLSTLNYDARSTTHQINICRFYVPYIRAGTTDSLNFKTLIPRVTERKVFLVVCRKIRRLGRSCLSVGQTARPYVLVCLSALCLGLPLAQSEATVRSSVSLMRHYTFYDASILLS